MLLNLGAIRWGTSRAIARQTPPNPIWAMLIIDGVPRLEVRGELIVDIIVEVKSSERPDVWIELGNVVDQIFEMHSQTADVVQQEREAISFHWLVFMPGRPFSSERRECGCRIPFMKNWLNRRKLMISPQHCKQEILFVNSCWSCSTFTWREEFVRIWVHWEERGVKGEERVQLTSEEDMCWRNDLAWEVEKPCEKGGGENGTWEVVGGYRRRRIFVFCWSVSVMSFALANPGRSCPVGTSRFPICSVRFLATGIRPVFRRTNSGLFRCIPAGSDWKVVGICPSKNRPESGCKEHDGTYRNRPVPVGSGKDPTGSCNRNDRPGKG